MIAIAGVAYGVESPFSESFEYVGEQTRNFDGGLSSQTRAKKRRWRCTTTYLTAAQVTTLQAAIDLDTPVTVVDTMRTITISAMVRAEADLTVTTLYKVRLDIREV